MTQPGMLASFLPVLAGALSCAVSVPLAIELQRRSRLGQHVYEDAPQSHSIKAGTPTLGGIAFALAALAGYALSGERAQALPLLLLVLAAAAIGMTDDLLILRARRALGLRARAKFGLLALVAIGYVTWVYRSGSAYPHAVWFGGGFDLPVWLWSTLAVLAIVGAANAVNLTDGLDGLAAGTTIPPLVALLLTARLQGLVATSAIGGACLGALLIFLLFNRHPARIFMGDTGSLALGALLAGLAIQSQALLLLPLFGMLFVVEALSVMAQVVSFKTTGRRIFKMSPLHHHFELLGWRETAVTSIFIVCAALASAATWITWWSTSMRA